MSREDQGPTPLAPEYAPTCIDSHAGRGDAGASSAAIDGPPAHRRGDASVDLDFLETGTLPFVPNPETRPIEVRLGLAVLRLRLYRGWSQAMLERASGVDQTLISRFERGKVPGLAMRRLYAMLKALRAEEIEFGPGRRPPQSSWEDFMYGDLWERAGRLAEARFNRRRSA